MSRTLLALAACLLVQAAGAHDYTQGDLAIGHPWSRPTMPGMSMGVAYLSITNRSKAADALIAASTPAATKVEFHETRVADGMARMRPLMEIDIPPGETVKIQPGGIHLMLVGLEAPLELGKSVPLTLEFRQAGKITVELAIEARDASPPAAESSMTQSLGVVTVVARRPSSLPTQIPTTIEGISGEAVERVINATDAEDALKYLPSLTVRKRYIGDYDHAVLASRASGTGNSARSLVFADGILLSNLLGNGATFTPRWGMVTPEEIERVDVLYGPFSAAYAGNSVGAVVDYVTRMPESLEVRAGLTTFTEDFDVHGAHGSYGGWQAHASYGDRQGATAWWVNFNRLDSESHPISFANKLLSAGAEGTGGIPVTGAIAGRDPRNRDWWLLGDTNTIGTIQDHGKIKLARDFGDHWRASYTLGVWRNEATRESNTWLRDADGAPVYSGIVNVEGRVFSIGPTEIAPSKGELTHVMQGLSVRRSHLGAWNLEATASLYEYRADASRSPLVAQPIAATGGAGRIADQSGTGWTTLAIRAVRESGGASSHTFELGVQHDHYVLRTEVSDTADNWLSGPAGDRFSAFRGDTQLLSAYAQDTWEFAHDWQATLGARIEHWHADEGSIAGRSEPLPFAARSETHVSPKLALAWGMTPDLTLKASLGRAVRLPTVAELFQGSIFANTIVNNDPDLEPEKSWTSEFSAIVMFDHGDLRATGFFEDTRDALYSQVNVAGGSTVTTIQNVDRIRTRGVEIVARAQPLATLELAGSLTYAHSRILENGDFPASEGARQPRVPEWRGNALATWRPNDRISATLGARYSGLQYNTLDNSDPHGTSYTGTSRYLVADARVRCEFDARWSGALGIDNLGNERYWAFHPYSRRTYTLELAARL